MRSRRAAAVPPNPVYETPCVVVGRFITIIIIFFSRRPAYTCTPPPSSISIYLSLGISLAHSILSSLSILTRSILSLCPFLSVGRYFTFSLLVFFPVVGFLRSDAAAAAAAMTTGRFVLSDRRTTTTTTKAEKKSPSPSPTALV